MKYLSMIATSLAALAFTACGSDDDALASGTQAPTAKTYTLSLEAQKGDEETRALSLEGNILNGSWAKGDVVKVYNSSGTQIGSLTAQSSGTTATLKGEVTTLPAVNDVLTLTYQNADYNSHDGTLTGTDKSIDKVCDYATATVTVQSVSGDDVSASDANVASHQAYIKFTLKDTEGNALGNPTAFTMTDGTSTVTLGNIPASTYSKNGPGVLYVAFPAKGSSADITLTATVGGAVYFCKNSKVTFENGKYYDDMSVKMKKSEPEAVDLKLSVKWASMNVGAIDESDYGLCFAWGETTGYTSANASDGHNFDWDTYKLCLGTHYTLMKYVMTRDCGKVDKKTTLEPAEDAATTVMGSPWRIPTAEEWEELLATRSNDIYDWRWTTSNGHYGWRITHKRTKAHIFLPAAGMRFYKSISGHDVYGHYWTASVYERDSRKARQFYFDGGRTEMLYRNRYCGFTIRAVQSK